MDDKKNVKEINLKKILQVSWSRRRLFMKTMAIAFIVSVIYIFPKPRYYTCNVKLAPETDNPATNGALSSLAQQFGFNIGAALSNDAIQPTFYPDVMESNDFAVKLFPIKVKTIDGEEYTYYDYLKNHQKQSIWEMPLSWLMRTIGNLFKDEEEGGSKGTNAFQLTRDEKDIVDLITTNVTCTIDKRTDAIDISVVDQDPLICATMADSVKNRLQDFITEYRTSKARIDLEYYKKLASDAKQDYEKARRLYGSYADANNDIVLESFRAKQTDLENDMQLKYNTYTVLNTQLQAAMAKVQENTPAFTIVQGASVPIKPTGPKRMFFIAGVLFLTFTITLLYVIRKDLKEQLD